jgi:hypothetical protein
MFSTSLAGPGSADTSLLVLPVVAKIQDADPHEEVMFVRDEMANMVWGVERTIPSGAGGGMPGPLSAAETAPSSPGPPLPCHHRRSLGRQHQRHRRPARPGRQPAGAHR